MSQMFTKEKQKLKGVQTMAKNQKCLQDLSVFSRLDEQEIELMCERAFEKNFNQGEFIFFENEKAKKLYFLIKGRVKLSMMSPEGKEKVIHILQEGDIFGEISIFDHAPQPLTAEVVEDATLIILSWKQLEEIIMKRPAMALKIIEALSKKTRLLTSQVRGLVFQDADARLADLIDRFSRDFGIEKKEGTVIELVLTHQEIANLIGTSRVTATKLLNIFTKQEIIKIKSKKIILIDKDKLKEKLDKYSR